MASREDYGRACGYSNLKGMSARFSRNRARNNELGEQWLPAVHQARPETRVYLRFFRAGSFPVPYYVGGVYSRNSRTTGERMHEERLNSMECNRMDLGTILAFYLDWFESWAAEKRHFDLGPEIGQPECPPLITHIEDAVRRFLSQKLPSDVPLHFALALIESVAYTTSRFVSADRANDILYRHTALLFLTEGLNRSSAQGFEIPTPSKGTETRSTRPCVEAPFISIAQESFPAEPSPVSRSPESVTGRCHS